MLRGTTDLTKYTKKQKEKMFDMYVNDRLTIKDIHKDMGIPLTTVSHIVRNMRKERGIPKQRHVGSEHKKSVGRKNRKYPDELKLDALSRVISHGEHISDVSDELDIPYSYLHQLVNGIKDKSGALEELENNISNKDHIKLTSKKWDHWYIDEDELLDLKQLLDDGHDHFTCAYVMGVEGRDFEKMLEALNIIKDLPTFSLDVILNKGGAVSED